MAAKPVEFSELEQQEELLAADGAPAKQPRLQVRGWALAVASALLLLSAAALWLRVGQPRQPSWHGVVGLVQAYALEEVGRPLTQEELVQVRRYAAAAKVRAPRVAAATASRASPLLRWLQEEEDQDGEEGNEEEEDQDGEEGNKEKEMDEWNTLLHTLKKSSLKCAEDMEALVGKIFDEVITRSMQVFKACMKDETSEACLNARKKLEAVEDDVKQECKNSGDMCTLVETTPKGNESEESCIPKSCHSSLTGAARAATKVLQEALPDCVHCKVNITC